MEPVLCPTLVSLLLIHMDAQSFLQNVHKKVQTSIINKTSFNQQKIMKKVELSKGKKLEKTIKKTILGGMLDCMEPRPCTEFPCETYPLTMSETALKFLWDALKKICRPQP